MTTGGVTAVLNSSPPSPLPLERAGEREAGFELIVGVPNAGLVVQDLLAHRCDFRPVDQSLGKRGGRVGGKQLAGRTETQRKLWEFPGSLQDERDHLTLHMRQTIRWVVAVLLLGLVGLALVALFLTRASAGASLLGAKRRAGKPMASASPVDETPLTQARKLVRFATTEQEQSLAVEALRLADHEVDLAFAQALRDAANAAPPETAAAGRLEQRVKSAQARVDADQAAIARLTRLSKQARAAAQARDQSQIELAKAQLSLDQDELADAHRDLMRSGGDEEAQLQQLLNEHEKSQTHESDRSGGSGAATGANSSNGPAGGSSPAEISRSLLARLSAWEAARNEGQMLTAARSAALAMAASLSATHNFLERKVQAEQASTPTAGAANAGAAATASALNSVEQLSRDQQDLASYDKRIEAAQELADVYVRWIAAAQVDAQAKLHRLFRSIFWVLLFLFLAVVADLLISRLFSRLSFDRKRLHTVRSVLHFTTRAIATVLILIVIFGPPQQLGTILALAGAGLTVALKDFIVGFLGWFVLMGRNGMRPGDWVEINGVQGKVLEVGLLFTVILETGNWTDAGHPTGRRVTFINSFAIEGHYFNFTTTGQWLWDEVQVGLPLGVDPHPVLDALQKVATKETEENAQQAEQDWKRVMAASGMGAFSAAPVITVRPTDTGLNIVVRYIVRADEREELRLRLYRAAFDMLLNGKALRAAPPAVAPRPEPV
jgi:small-conductance mechanosensitive channel